MELREMDGLPTSSSKRLVGNRAGSQEATTLTNGSAQLTSDQNDVCDINMDVCPEESVPLNTASNGNLYVRSVTYASNSCAKLWGRFCKPIAYAVGVLVLCLYCAFFVYSCYRDFNAAIPLVIITSLVLIFKVYALIRDRFSDRIDTCLCEPIISCHRKTRNYTRWVVYIGIPVALVLFLVFDAGRNPTNLRSAGALVIFTFTLFVTSKDPARVNWRPVVCGLGLQFILGLIIVRWTYGYQAFKFLGEQVSIFAHYADEGSKTVFGDPFYLNHPVAFQILPIVVFFSCVINIMYYVGAVQWVILKFGWLMRVTMETSAVESLHAAASIFMGPIECTVMFRPFIKNLTQSELNAMMTAGFATVAGTVVAAYIQFGAPGEHVIAATIMSAPAALAIAKLQVPETEKSLSDEKIDFEESQESNIIEAACQGAAASIKLVAIVAVNLIAFLGLLAFIDATFSYCGGLVGYPEFSFKTICSYVFMPLAYMIGIPWDEAGTVGGLIGTKIFFSEFIAFQQMQSLIQNNEITPRTKDITTYVLTGFGSVASIGIYVGSLIATVPSRKEEFARTGIRAMIGGNFACFMTASICGLLYDGSVLEMENEAVNITTSILNSTYSILL